MAEIRPSELLREYVIKASISNQVLPEMRCSLQDYLSRESFPTDAMNILNEYFFACNENVSLLDCMRGSQIVFPSMKPVPSEKPSTEYEKRMEHLKLMQQKKEYNQMVHGTMKTPSDSESIETFSKSMKYATTISANMITTMIAMFGLYHPFRSSA
mmetsp:Transcript_29168/g.29520  ORF Transcript_29168/g.29520 Transcript_29168/m.29520 type:complete len:156 (-) Transcript_29168:296-763(-)